MSDKNKPESEINPIQNLIWYMEKRIEREKAEKEKILSSGDQYYGVLSMLEEQLENIKDGSFWKQYNNKEEVKKDERPIRSNQGNNKPVIKSIEDLVKVSETVAELGYSKQSKKEKIKSIDDNEVDSMSIELHKASIQWAENLTDIKQKESWLTFFESVNTPDKNIEYWSHIKKAVKRPWVLEMNGLLTNQNGIMPSLEERRMIWDKNYEIFYNRT